jgi:hypothetical protein
MVNLKFNLACKQKKVLLVRPDLYVASKTVSTILTGTTNNMLI